MIRNKNEILKNAGTKIDYKAREIALNAIEVALKECDPIKIFKKHVKLKDNILTIKGHSKNNSDWSWESMWSYGSSFRKNFRR